MLETRRFRKRPVEIEAVQLTEGNIIDVAQWCGGHSSSPSRLTIPTLEGAMTAIDGDWVIRGVQGEFYSCRADIFRATYGTVDG